MNSKFGKTWWGTEWLNALSQIDFSNRLPRGRSYANKGAVTSLEIQNNLVISTVSGSRPRPYDVTITIPTFSKQETKSFIAALKEKPIIISKLLMRDLDPQVLSLAEKSGLNVFPKKWSDLDLFCSCPDYAVPCKHLAAVIYKLSVAIDNNPFMIFLLHDLDLIQALKDEDIYISRKEEIKVSYLSDLLGQEISPKKESHTLNKGMESMSNALISLLVEDPPFYSGTSQFRNKYEVILGKLSSSASKWLKGKEKPAPFSDGVIMQEFHLEWNNNLEPKIIIPGIKKTKPPVLSFYDFIGRLWEIPYSQKDDYSSPILYCRSLLHLAVNLIHLGGITPQIVKLTKGKSDSYAIRWMPATLSKEVRAAVSDTNVLLGKAQDEAFKVHYLKEKQKILVNRPEDILSIFLTEIVSLLYRGNSKDEMLNFFFGRSFNAYGGIGENEIPGAIEEWLKPYYFSIDDFQPSFILRESEKETFELDLQVKLALGGDEKRLSLSDLFVKKQFKKHCYNALTTITRLNALIPGLDEYLNAKGMKPLTMNKKECAEFLFRSIPVIRLLNLEVFLPKSMQEIIHPKPSVRVKQKDNPGESNSFLRLSEMLDFDWQIALGDELMDENEFKKLTKGAEGLIRFKSQYIYSNPNDLEKLYDHFHSGKKLSSFDILQIGLSEEYFGAPVRFSDEARTLIQSLSSQTNEPIPNGLEAKLRPYQHRGYSWLIRNGRLGFGSVLADDMGLGKTLQVITYLLQLKEKGELSKKKALVVAPTGLLSNWQSEIEKFAPSLKTEIYHGANRNKLTRFEVLLTSYGMVRRDLEKLKKENWHTLVIDEAQAIKNSQAQQSKAIKSISADIFIALSGTPVENRLSELWSIMDYSNRKLLGSIKQFQKEFVQPIEKEMRIEKIERLKSITAPFLMRRLKSDKSIIDDLPEKMEMNAFCSLTKSQIALYQKTVDEAMAVIEEQKGKSALFKRQGLVLQMILSLKQICNHPAHFLKTGSKNPNLSGKAELLLSKLDGILENNEKVLVFTQFKEMGDLLQDFVEEKLGQETLFYHGGCTMKQRNEMVDSFQNDKRYKIFILSLKAAGTGLNLTAANHVIHYDLWWNPAVESQATDRAYRIGQKKDVLVHRFITKNTFEEKIDEMIQSKKKLAELTISSGENWIGNLSTKELNEVFRLSK